MMYIDVNEFIDRKSDSDMIQAALDAARPSGASVVVPKINKRTGKTIWNIDKTVKLYDDSILILQNAHLRLSDGVICNMFRNADERNKNITIKGIGKSILDGGTHNGLYEVNGIARTVSKYPERHAFENCTLIMMNVENLLIDNITVRDQRYWAFCLCSVTHSRVSNIHFESSSNVPNQDGVDLLRGCHDVIIENITGCVGDNAVTLIATESDLYPDKIENLRDGDVYNITVRNLMIYGVGGCSLVRILNHDGYRIYNVKIDNLIEVSPWSENDSSVAPNPDLNIVSDKDGNIISLRHLTPGEEGYRCEAAIIIGESYWYKKSKAQPGDTFGISISNVMTHARFGIWLNNAVKDSTFENIRVFGNGHTAVFFGEGTMERLSFTGIRYDEDVKPCEEDKDIIIEWNNTESHGFNAVYFNGTKLRDVEFSKMRVATSIDNVFAGHGEGDLICTDVKTEGKAIEKNLDGIKIAEK